MTNTKAADEEILRELRKADLKKCLPKPVLKEWLTEKRDIARQVLAEDGWMNVDEGPLNLNPKSAAWRSMVAQAAPLKPWEKRNLHDVADVAEEWLAILETAGEETVRLLSQACRLVRGAGGMRSDLLFRVLAADQEDAGLHRRELLKRLRGIQKAAQRNTKATDEEILSELRKADKKHSSETWEVKCLIAGRALGLSGRQVRRRFPQKKFRATVE